MMAIIYANFSRSYSFRLSKDFQMGAEVYASPEKGALDWVIILVCTKKLQLIANA